MGIKKVAVVTGDNKQCGIYVYAERLKRAFQELNLEADLLSLPESTNPSINAGELKNFARSLESYDLVVNQHEYFLWGETLKRTTANFACFTAALKGRVRHVAQMHTVSPAFLGLDPQIATAPLKYCLQKTWESVDKVVVHEERSKQLLLQGFAWAQSNKVPEVIVHYHPCPAAPEATARQTPEDTINMTIFGFFGYYKGHHVLIELLKTLPQKYRLTIAGGAHPKGTISTQYYNEILALIDSYKLHDRIRITGWLQEEDIAAELKKTDIAVLPYLSEELSASGAIRELLSHGLPIVASDVPAFSDMAQHTQAVKIFKRNDLDSLKTELHNALSNYSAMSKEAIDFCLAHSYESLALRMLELPGTDNTNHKIAGYKQENAAACN